MLLSGAPSPIPLPFANSGTRNAIPTASQISVTPGRASLTDGFPPLTRTPLAAGGVPPFGEDMNGILYSVTQLLQWQSSGGFFPFSSAQASAIGGYPKGAILVKADGSGYWQNLADGNSNNPDTGGANWADLGAALNGRPGRAYASADWFWLDKAAGLIAQYGTVTTPSGGPATVTFPITFPSVVFGSWATNQASVVASNGWAACVASSTSQLLVSHASAANTYTAGVACWFAIGK